MGKLDRLKKEKNQSTNEACRFAQATAKAKAVVTQMVPELLQLPGHSQKYYAEE